MGMLVRVWVLLFRAGMTEFLDGTDEVQAPWGSGLVWIGGVLTNGRSC